MGTMGNRKLKHHPSATNPMTLLMDIEIN